MKILILQQDLLPSLQAVSRVSGVRATLPVLDNILLASEGVKLKLSATNLEIGVIEYVSADVIEPGEITIPAKTLVEVISGLKGSKIDLESKQDILTITSGKFQASINGISSSEFPVIPQGEGGGISFKKSEIMAVGQILFAAAVDEGRPQLTGVLTEVKGNDLNFVATDGFRLAHRIIKLEDKKDLPEGRFKSLIPKKTFEEVLRIISEEEIDDIKVSTSSNQNQIVFKIGSTTVSSRLIEGNFPNWEKIIPENFVTRAVVDKEEIIKAVKLASVFVKNEGFIVLKVSTDKIVIEASAKELGTQQNEIEGQMEGEELTVGFNAKFLLDSLINIPSTQLTMEFSGSLTPTAIKPIGIEGLQFIVMPMRLN